MELLQLRSFKLRNNDVCTLSSFPRRITLLLRAITVHRYFILRPPLNLLLRFWLKCPWRCGQGSSRLVHQTSTYDWLIKLGFVWVRMFTNQMLIKIRSFKNYLTVTTLHSLCSFCHSLASLQQGVLQLRHLFHSYLSLKYLSRWTHELVKVLNTGVNLET